MESVWSCTCSRYEWPGTWRSSSTRWSREGWRTQSSRASRCSSCSPAWTSHSPRCRTSWGLLGYTNLSEENRADVAPSVAWQNISILQTHLQDKVAHNLDLGDNLKCRTPKFEYFTSFYTKTSSDICETLGVIIH